MISMLLIRWISLILIPDSRLNYIESQQKSTPTTWTERLLKNTLPRSSILSFEYDFILDDVLNWQRFFEGGKVLLDTILDLRRDDKLLECPIHLICLGLGGIIAKEAIQIAYQQTGHFKDLLLVLSGAVFVGVPHLALASESKWKDISKVVKLDSKSLKKFSLGLKEVESLANVCHRFENMVFDKPTLSVFETKATPIGGAFSKKALIIGREFGTTGVKNETLLGIDCEYSFLQGLNSDEEMFQRVSKFVRSSVATTQAQVNFELRRRVDLLHADRYTVGTESIAPDRSDIGDDYSTPKNSRHGTNGSTTASYEIIPMPTEFTVVKPIARLPCYIHSNQTRNRYFFGRTGELKAIEDVLISPVVTEERELRSFAMCGVGGLGKTEIAAEFMFRNQLRFDAVFWLQADSRQKLLDDFRQISVQLGLETMTDASDPAISRDLVKAWLANPEKEAHGQIQEATWLLIYDNLDDPEILADFWPEFGRGSVLITSRDPLAKTNLYSAMSGLDLKPFSDEDGAKFLLQSTDPEDNAEDAKAVARKLGGLPLGLTQMSGIIRRQDYTFDEFLRRYDEKSLSNLHGLKIGVPKNGYEHTIASVFALETLGKESLDLLNVMSMLDPDSIKENIFTEAVDSTKESFLNSLEAYEEARADLTKRSLINRFKKGKSQHELRIHRLTQDATRGRMSTEVYAKVFNSAVDLLSNAWPYVTLNQRLDPSRWSTYQSLTLHVIRLFELTTSFVFPHKITPPSLNLAKLLTDCAWSLNERSILAQSSELLNLSLEICETQRANALHTLSDIYYAKGAVAAESNQIDEQFENNSVFLNIRLEISSTSEKGRRDPLLAQAYNQAANANLDMNQVEKAIELYKTALEVFQSLDDYKETNTTIFIANLGTAYWIHKQYENAESILMQNLRARELEFGHDDTTSYRTGRLLHVLGNVRASQGRLSESFDFHNRALCLYRTAIGNNHHRTADLCHKVAGHYIRLGCYQPAKDLLQQALKVYNLYSRLANEQARSSYLMSKLLFASGEQESAKTFASDAIRLYRKVKPNDIRPNEAITEEDYDNAIGFQSR